MKPYTITTYNDDKIETIALSISDKHVIAVEVNQRNGEKINVTFMATPSVLLDVARMITNLAHNMEFEAENAT